MGDMTDSNKAAMTVGAVMCGAVTLPLWISLVRSLAANLIDAPPEQRNGSAAAPAAHHAGSAAAAATSTPADLAPLFWFTGAVAAVIVLAVVSYQIAKAYTRRSRARDARDKLRAAQQCQWDEAMTAWNGVRAAVTAAETDPRAATERPLLCDVAEPATVQFWQAFARAEAAYTDTIPSDDEAIDEFTTAVEAARQAFEAADTNAREKVIR